MSKFTLILGHECADMDCVTSQLLIAKCHSNPVIAIQKNEAHKNALKVLEELGSDITVIDAYDIAEYVRNNNYTNLDLVVVDTHDFFRIDGLSWFDRTTAATIDTITIYDHHVRAIETGWIGRLSSVNQNEFKITIIVRPDYPSAASLIYDKLYKNQDIDNHSIKDLVTLGTYADTVGFLPTITNVDYWKQLYNSKKEYYDAYLDVTTAEEKAIAKKIIDNMKVESIVLNEVEIKIAILNSFEIINDFNIANYATSIFVKNYLKDYDVLVNYTVMDEYRKKRVSLRSKPSSLLTARELLKLWNIKGDGHEHACGGYVSDQE